MECYFTSLLQPESLPEGGSLLHLANNNRVVLQVSKGRWQCDPFSKHPLCRAEAVVVAKPAASLTNPIASNSRCLTTDHVHVLEHLFGLAVCEVSISRHGDQRDLKVITHFLKSASEC